MNGVLPFTLLASLWLFSIVSRDTVRLSQLPKL